jgi:hypothetical protein
MLTRPLGAQARSTTGARALRPGTTPLLADNAGWAPGPIATIALAAAITGVPVVLHLAGAAVGIAVCVMLALLVANFAAPTVPIVLIFSYLFQNLFVALVSPAITDMDQFNAIRAYNFILTAVIWIVVAWTFWTARASFDRRFRALMDVTTVALVSIGIYFVVGLTANPSGAIIYLRNIVAPFLLLQIFAVFAYRHRISMSCALVAIASLTLLYGYLELFAHDNFLRLVNGDTYINWRVKESYEAGVQLKELQETGRVMRSYLDALEIDFLNTPLFRDLGLSVYRIVGPNFHFISFAYALAFFSVVLAALGRWWYVVVALPMLLVVGSKGALIVTVLVTAAIAALPYLRGRSPLWIFMAVLAIYAAVGIMTGIQMQDYHVIGFVGGVLGLMNNPIGRGIGVGGNLVVDVATIDWSRSQQLGQIDPVMESAVGVLFYQMGVFALVPLAVLVWLAFKLWGLYMGSRNRLFAAGAFSLLTITVNGIFQEEALFSPLAVGVVLALAGLLLGRAFRTMPVGAAAVRHAATPAQWRTR